MKLDQQIRQCLWLIDSVYEAKKITFEDLNNKWKTSELGDGTDLSRTTFNRIRDAVQTIFGIIIECELKGGYHYYIYNEEELTCKQLMTDFCKHCPCRGKEQKAILCLPQNCIYLKID